MEKKQAQEYIKQVLNSRFDQEQFELFVRNLLNEFEPKEFNHSGQLIPEAFRDHISHFKRLGVYTDPEAEKMDILIVQTKSVSKLERTRTALRNFVVRHLKNREKFYALVAFYSKEDDGREWRLSLVKIDIETERTESGKIKTKEEIVPAKRFSYLVGEYENAHTAQKQLLPLLVNDHSNPLIIKEKDGDGSVEGAFSIEKVTDEFYEQYKELYLKLTENVTLTETLKKEDLDPVRFVKKLLGQIVFLYFLQKKGWLGVPKDRKMGEGPKNFLRKKFDEINEDGGDYFNDFLRYLFYEALAKEHHDEGIKYFNKRLACKIPFLNGGLFEADYENWDTLDLDIDNSLFSNPNKKTKGGDKGTGILDVFDRYNFTIREDEPLEKEVAVDPEMLGKVFENLLEVTDRKSKGAFYTPREIVHYMCQESLIHYLDNTVNHYTESYQPIDSDQTSLFGGSTDKKGNLKIELENKGDIRVPKIDLEQMIRKGHLVLEHETTVTSKGRETDSYQYKLPESIRKHAKVLDQALADIKICDPAIGSGAFPVGMLQEIVTARKVLVPYLDQPYIRMLQKQSGITDADTMPSDYYFKRHSIQNSIYGVDIDASAIDIARLRLWLSMIVDEEDYDTIDALPNLDYKIVCGNSLIGSPENAMRDLNIEAELEKLKKEFFHETDERKKKALRQKIDQKIRQLLDSAESFASYQIKFDFKLFFSEVWHQKGGFDVVIGNPPYVDIKQLPKEVVNFLMEHYETTQNRINLYSAFIEKGLGICNKRGNLIFINPNSMLLNSSYKKLRRQIIDKVILAIKLPNKVFKEATVETIIVQIGNSRVKYPVAGAFYFKDEQINFDKIRTFYFDREVWKNDPDNRISIFTTPDQLKLLGQISGNKSTLISCFDFCLGITPYDKYKGHTKEQIKNRVFHSPSKEDSSYVPLISGSNIHRFFVNETDIKEYLKYGEWLGAPRKQKFFTEPRVIVRQIVSGKPLLIYAGYTKTELYHTQIGFSIIKKNTEGPSLKALCAYLNSDALNFYHKFKFLDIEKETFQKVLIENCKSFPLPNFASKTYLIERIFDYCHYSFKLDTNQLLQSFWSELNSGVFYEIFFLKEIKSANKQILPYLDDLKPITDEMSEEEKLAIIQSEFERLYDPNHPVRNNLETLDSVEEVRIIKEALK
jgi:hypothetical protein